MFSVSATGNDCFRRAINEDDNVERPPVSFQSFTERLYRAHLAWRSADLSGALDVLASWGESIRKQSKLAAEDHLRRLIKMQRAPSMTSTGALENVSLDRSVREVLIPAHVSPLAATARMHRGSWPRDSFG